MLMRYDRLLGAAAYQGIPWRFFQRDVVENGILRAGHGSNARKKGGQSNQKTAHQTTMRWFFHKLLL